MYVILVHWLIKKGVENENAFKKRWKEMAVELDDGLFREILTKPVPAEDPKFNTFSVTNEAYVTYINIGIWKDLDSFDKAMEQYITKPERRVPLDPKIKDKKLTLYLEDFEFKIRERIVLEKVKDRAGKWDLTEADL